MSLDGQELVNGAPAPDPNAAENAESQQPAEQPAAGAGATGAANGVNGQPKPAWTPADTQAAQQLAELKRELGLPRNARWDTVKERIAEMQAPPAPANGIDYDNLDPEAAARMKDYEDRLWAKNEELYGDVFVPEARDLYERILAERDPDKAVQHLLQFVIAVTDAGEGEEGEPAEGQQAAPPMPELGNADVPVSPRITRTDPTGGRRDTGLSGMTDFVREKLGLPAPPPR